MARLAVKWRPEDDAKLFIAAGAGFRLTIDLKSGDPKIPDDLPVKLP